MPSPILRRSRRAPGNPGGASGRCSPSVTFLQAAPTMPSVHRAMLGLVAITACAPRPDREADRAALLALTARAGTAHTTGDAAAFLAAVDSGWWAAGNGQWSYREKAAALPGIAAYFAST